MQDMVTKSKRRRLYPRNQTKTRVKYQVYSSSNNVQESDGIMRNFSNEGFYIETSYKYKSGNILIVRIVNYLTNPLSDTENEQPRSISLAKVKWHHEISCENIIKYGMGMEYID